jgi:glutamyl/glutaminyl-tRNA synthetase
MGTDGKKLSKRRGAKGVLDFKKEGFLSEALLNYLMLLGWSPKDDREVLSKEEISQSFTLGKVNSSPSIFDERKLLWMNGEYLRQMSAEDLGKRLIEFDPSSKDGMSDDDFVKFVRSAQTRIKTLADFKPMVVPFFQPIENKTDLLKEYASVLGLIPQDQWNSETIIARTVEFMQNGNIKFPQIYQDLTGQKSGLPLGEVFEILGRDKTIAWLK